jgi:hypothetical protein
LQSNPPTHALTRTTLAQFKVAEIDLRGPGSPFIRDKPNDIRIRKIKESAVAAASQRVQDSRELRVTLLAPYAVDDDEGDLAEKRAAVESVLGDLRDDAASCGVTLTFTDINGPHVGNEETLLRLLPLSLKAINESDLIVVVDGADLLPAPGTIKRKSQFVWAAETFTNAVQQGFTAVRRGEGCTLFQLQLKHLLENAITTCDTAIFQKQKNAKLPRGGSTAGGGGGGPGGGCQDTLDDLALSTAVQSYRSNQELRHVIDRNLTAQVRALLDGVHEPVDDGSEGGAGDVPTLHHCCSTAHLRLVLVPFLVWLVACDIADRRSRLGACSLDHLPCRSHPGTCTRPGGSVAALRFRSSVPHRQLFVGALAKRCLTFRPSDVDPSGRKCHVYGKLTGLELYL